jgi:hypothetical protein
VAVTLEPLQALQELQILAVVVAVQVRQEQYQVWPAAVA